MRRGLAGVILVTAALCLVPELADARVGGGETFGRGGGGSGSGGWSGDGGGSGGGGGEIDLIFLLFHLCVEYPVIGVPLTLCVLGFVVAPRPLESRIGATAGPPQRSLGPTRGVVTAGASP